MKFEELLSSKYIMFAFIGLCAGILALTAVEVGDDFIPAVLLAFVCFIMGVMIILRLKKDFVLNSLPFFLLGFICPVYGFDGFFEDIAEFFLGLGAILGFVMAIFSILSLLISYQKESENK